MYIYHDMITGIYQCIYHGIFIGIYQCKYHCAPEVCWYTRVYKIQYMMCRIYQCIYHGIYHDLYHDLYHDISYGICHEIYDGISCYVSDKSPGVYNIVYTIE
jgi:hypothetical protein